MMADHPVTRVGRGGFHGLSPTGRSDRDARRAHNSHLQHGAETGLIRLIVLAQGFSSFGDSQDSARPRSWTWSAFSGPSRPLLSESTRALTTSFSFQRCP